MKLSAEIVLKLYAVGLSCQLVFSPLVSANQANPSPIFEKQPDGSLIELRIKGDEHFHWSEDKSGYTVLRHNGWYKYAQKANNGRLIASQHLVGKADPAEFGFQKRIKPSMAVQAESAKNNSDENVAQGVAPIGAVKNLVVLIRFADHVDRSLPSVANVNALFNAPGGDPVVAPTGSIRDLYLKNSYSQFILDSAVQAWITLPQSEAYYANGQSGDSTLWQALRYALDQLDATINFNDFDANNDGQIDAISFLHSGYGAEWGGTDAYGTHYSNRIWSHRWVIQQPAWTSTEGVKVSDYHISPSVWSTSGNEIGRIGVIAHETGHFFGLPDLYDTNGGGEGIGSYGLMANSWGFDGSQYCPPHLSPWSKTLLGWYSPQVINTSGEYTLRLSEEFPEVYKITQGFPNDEYLLVENRQNAGFDCSLPQGGIAIWHIDELADYVTEGYPGQVQWPQNNRHYQVALLQADGDYDLERGNNRGDSGDIFHGAVNNAINEGPSGHPNTDTYQSGDISQTGNSITNISSSGEIMTFCLNGCSPTPIEMVAPSNLTADVQKIGKGKKATKIVTLSWKDNSSIEDNFIIERCKEEGRGRNKTCDFTVFDTVGTNITHYGDEPDSGTFKYRVRASNSIVQSGYSNEVKI